jgi:voltage-gated potassium channel Kch
LHSVNEGQYGGETIYVWDPERKSIVYHYFTTAGFFTEGAATFEGNRMLTHETLRGNAGGITEVRSTAEFLPDGRVRVVAEYLKAGAWTTGHQAVYAPDSAAVVVLH